MYAGQEWIARQAELVTSLTWQQHPVLAHNAVQAVRRFLDLWGYYEQMSLLDSYKYARRHADGVWRRAHEAS